MDSLILEVRKIRKQPLSGRIDARLSEFSSFHTRSGREWFSELCFCILTANSKGRTAYAIQQELGAKGFCEYCADDVRACIMSHKHRFHNNKTRYIIEARNHTGIREVVRKIADENGQKKAREWIVSNIKGLGYKEASHFLRNVGYFDLAILDRHVLNLLDTHGIIKRPKSLSKKSYLEIEHILAKISEKLGMSQAELDMYLWYMKTNDVLK